MRKQAATRTLHASRLILGLATCLMLSTANGALAQQDGAKIFGGNILTDKPTAPVAGRYYYPDRLLVTFKKGVTGAELISQIINQRKESSPGRRDLQVKLQMSNDSLGLVTITPPKIEQELFGAQPYMVLETPASKENSLDNANRSDDWLMASLKASGKVAEVTRDYVLFAHDGNSDAINSILSPHPYKAPAPIGTKPKHTQKALYPDDRFFKLQWHLKLHGTSETATTSPGASNFPLVWRGAAGKTQPVIAVIDTGLYYDHEDIRGNKRILPGYDFISNLQSAEDGDGIDNDPTDPGTGSAANSCPTRAAEQDNWHGTHVAGLAGAVGSNNAKGITGGSWHARIVPIRVLGRCGTGSLFDIVRAMLWAGGVALNGVPDNLNPAKIINLSLGAKGQCPAQMQRAVDFLVKRGVTIVTSAGNDAIDATQAFPAGCANVIAVAAGDARGHIAPYSNYGPRVDLLAPGGDLRRDDNGDKFADGMLSAFKGGYKYYQGTSQAAPMVAAAAALIKSQNPTYGPKQILATLKKAANPRSKQQCAKGCGAGLLDVAPLVAKSAHAKNRY